MNAHAAVRRTGIASANPTASRTSCQALRQRLKLRVHEIEPFAPTQPARPRQRKNVRHGSLPAKLLDGAHGSGTDHSSKVASHTGLMSY